MDQSQIATKLAFDAIGLPVEVASFNDRLIAQKTVYLCQTDGIQLGYTFRWYLRGPYSPSLTKDVFAVSVEMAAGSKECEDWRLDESSEGKLAKLKGLSAGNENRDALARRLELLASVHFVVDHGQIPVEDRDGIAETLDRFGKDFTPEEIREALGELHEHELLGQQ